MGHPSSVLVVYQHELLGEGLAARLRALGVDTTTAGSHDLRAVIRALRRRPDVVVLETTDEQCLARVSRLSPTSRLVDVRTAVGRGYPAEAMRFEVILEALRPDAPQGASASRTPPACDAS